MKASIDIELTFGCNYEWHLKLVDFANFLEEENILWMLENPRLNGNGGVLVQAPIFSFMFLIQIGNISMPNEIICCHGLFSIHTLSLNHFMLVINLFNYVVQTQLNLVMIFQGL
jgi:hypothetical protein